MTLFEKQYEDLERLKAVRVPDGEGGSLETLVKVDTVKAAVTVTAAANRQEADKAAAHNVYSVTAPRGTDLKFGNILRRSTGQLLILTGDAIATPAQASFAFEKATADEWEG